MSSSPPPGNDRATANTFCLGEATVDGRAHSAHEIPNAPWATCVPHPNGLASTHIGSPASGASPGRGHGPLDLEALWVHGNIVFMGLGPMDEHVRRQHHHRRADRTLDDDSFDLGWIDDARFPNVDDLASDRIQPVAGR